MNARAAFAAALASTAMLASASSADPLVVVGGEALSLQADKLDVDVSAGEALLTGNVAIAKGELRVACPRIELRFDAATHVKWAKGSQGVSADVRGVHAEAPEVELDLVRQVLELRGGVKLSRGLGWLQAERATIDVASGKVSLAQVKGSLPVPAAK